MPDRVLIALQRKLAQTDDPDKIAAYEARINDLEALEAGDLTKLKKPDLVDLAEKRGIDTDGMLKEDIITALEET